MLPIVLLIPDLFFSVKVADTARALGYNVREAATAERLAAAVRDGATAVVLDTQTRGDWQAAVRELKADPQTQHVPILAFGSHVNVAAAREAVAAGCDRLVTRGKLAAELPTLLHALLGSSAAH